MKEYIFFIICFLGLFFSNPLYAQGKSTVYVSPKLATAVQGRHLLQTSPTLTITVPSGQWCKVHLSQSGVADTTGVNPVTTISTGGNIIQHITNYQHNAAAGSFRSGNAITMDLSAGTYTWATAVNFAASLGNISYWGLCYYL